MDAGQRAPGTPAITPADRPARSLQPGSAPPGGDSADLERILRILRRRKWWVIQALVLVPVVVLLVTLQQDKEYTATATLLFRDPTAGVLDTSVGPVDPDRQAATNTSLVVLPAVADRAASMLGDDITGAEVARSTSVDGDETSDVAEINATAEDPERAAEIANAYGEAFIEFRREIDQGQLDDAIATVRESIAALEPAEADSADAENLQEELNRLLVAQSLQTGNAELVQRASAPSSASSPNVTQNVAVGLILGALLGVGAALLRDRSDDSLRTVEDLEAVYGVPVVARVPRSRGLATSGSVTPGIPEPRTETLEPQEAEAFRTLRLNLRFFSVSREIRSLLVASPMSGEGKSTVALHLAKTMAAMGDNVVLVEADMHKLVASYDGLSARRGLSSVLTGSSLKGSLITVPVDDHGPQTSGRRLTVLPAGPPPPNPSELLESDRMAALLTSLENQFERVIIDSPAFSHVSDSRPLVGRVAGVLIVSAVDYTRRSAAEQFRKELELLDANVLGVVANLSPASKHGGYDYYAQS